jgi:putative hydrolase of HD superfamily
MSRPVRDIDTPEHVVQRQLDAYNARDLDAWVDTYAADARQFEYPDTLLARGHDEIRARAESRFAEPHLHARLLQRVVLGDMVIDHESVTRTFPEGAGRIELVCMYQVRAGKIVTASFVFGAKSLDVA